MTRAAASRGLGTASRIVEARSSSDAAALLRALAASNAAGAAPIDLEALARVSGLASDGPSRERFEEARSELTAAVGTRLLDLGPTPPGRAEPGFRLSWRLREVLSTPLPKADGTGEAAAFDSTTSRWIELVAASALARRALHFLLRCEEDRAADVARALASQLRGGRLPVVVADAGGVAQVVLRAELHAPARGAVVLVAPSLVVRAAASAEPPDEWFAEVQDGDGPQTAALEVADEFMAMLPALTHAACTYVWRMPPDAAVPRALDGVVSGCIGPVGFDRAWARDRLSDASPGLTEAGRGALLAQLRDPRQAGAMAAAAEVAAGMGVMPADEAAAFVARSFGFRPGGFVTELPGPAFDPRLVVADHDVSLMLSRAGHLARSGARVLLAGPPGGGKTSLALALAAAMAVADGGARRPLFKITPALVLRRGWGDSERILSSLWARASAEGGIVFADELDSLAGARDPSASGGNAHLVRCLTDQFLRDLDANPAVPFVAAVNALESVDEALRRRCPFVVSVAADLTPDRERLAWETVLGRDPPPRWRPVGASLADIAMAAAGCRMLGLDDADALAAAIARARVARRGVALRVRGEGSVH